MKQKQNKKAFSELIQKNQAIIHKITRVYENSWADREDLFQEICLQLWLSYPNFREEAKFSTWMYRVALNTAISNIRKSKKNLSFEPLRETDRIPNDSNIEKENVQLLYRAISKLSRIDKAIIFDSRFIAEFCQPEIQYFHHPFFIYHNITGFNVPVDDLFAVGFDHSAAYLDANV